MTDPLAELSVHLGNGPGCSGTLITNRYVLTAGHCALSQPGNVPIHGPLFTTVTSRSGASVSTDYAMVHPDFMFNVYGTTDVAVVHLASPLGPGTLRTELSDSTTQTNASLTCYGWGYATEPGVGNTDTLRRGTLSAVDAGTVQLTFRRTTTSQTILTKGDSGGGCFDSFGRIAAIEAGDSINGGGFTYENNLTQAAYVRNWVNRMIFAESTELSTAPNKMTRFRQDAFGYVWFSDWGLGSNPSSWSSPAKMGNSGNQFPPQKVAAVSRNASHQDIFLRGFDGKIYTAWRELGGGWTSFAPVINDGNVFDGDVGASAKGDNVTITAMKKNGDIYETHWDLNNAYERWDQFAPWLYIGAGFTFSGNDATRIALAQASTSTVNFYGVLNNGRIYTRSRTNPVCVPGVPIQQCPRATWSSSWVPLGTASDTFPTQTLAALGHGAISTVFGQTSTGQIRGTDSTFAGGSFYDVTSTAYPRQTLSVVSRNSGHVDIFLRGGPTKNQIYNIWKEAGPWTTVGPIGDSSNLVPAVNVASASLDPNQVSFFVAGWDNALWSASWTLAGGWTPWTFYL